MAHAAACAIARNAALPLAAQYLKMTRLAILPFGFEVREMRPSATHPGAPWALLPFLPGRCLEQHQHPRHCECGTQQKELRITHGLDQETGAGIGNGAGHGNEAGEQRELRGGESKAGRTRDIGCQRHSTETNTQVFGTDNQEQTHRAVAHHAEPREAGSAASAWVLHASGRF